MGSAYGIVWGQCSDLMRQRVKSNLGYGSFTTNFITIDLLQAIHDVAYNFKSTKYLPHLLYDEINCLYFTRMDKSCDVQTYLEKFKSNLDVLEHISATLGPHPILDAAEYERLEVTA